MITNLEYTEFIAAGGYDDPRAVAVGWLGVRQQLAIAAPMYWRQADGVWLEYQLDGERELLADAPVTHVSYFEADAYARWAGARLAHRSGVGSGGARVCRAGQLRRWGAAPATRHVAALGPAVRRLLGMDVERLWPLSWLPDAGRRLGEYNGKFMSGQQVLRGGSCATPPGHVRASYRNFFYPKDRWQFTGIRLAKSMVAA